MVERNSLGGIKQLAMSLGDVVAEYVNSGDQ